MGDGFTTQVRVLRGAGRKAHTLSEELRAQAAGWLDSGTVDAGHSPLGQEIQAFGGWCHDTTRHFTEEGDSIGERLIASANAYHRVDTTHAGTFTKVLPDA